MTKGRIACIAVEGAILDGLIELHTCPAQKVCDWIPYSRSKWRSRPQWSEVYRHRALLTDAFVASRGFLLAQSDVTAACLRVAKNRHVTARTEDAEHCAYRLRCMMSQLRSARVDKISPPSKYDLLRGVMMMAHITAPPSQWQQSNSKKTDASWEDEMEDSHEINDTAFDARTPAPEKSSCSVFVKGFDEELDEVTVVSHSRFDTEEKLDALMRNLCVSVTSSEVVPGDCIIDYNKLDEEIDGEVVVGPTAQGYKQQFSHAKAKPKAESSNRTASGAVNRSGSVYPLVKRAGKTKSGVSTPVKTKRGSSKVSTPVKTWKGSSGVSTPVKTKKSSSKKQDTPSSRANAKDALDPSDRKRIYSRGYHRERTSWKNRGFDVSSAACQGREVCWARRVGQRDQPQKTDLENAL